MVVNLTYCFLICREASMKILVRCITEWRVENDPLVIFVERQAWKFCTMYYVYNISKALCIVSIHRKVTMEILMVCTTDAMVSKPLCWQYFVERQTLQHAQCCYIQNDSKTFYIWPITLHGVNKHLCGVLRDVTIRSRCDRSICRKTSKRNL